jgi:Myb/SANT-like DNA-binding domain
MTGSKWTQEKQAWLVDMLLEADNNGKRSDNGWKKEAWEKIRVEFSERFHGNQYDVQTLKNGWFSLRKAFLMVKTLRSQSGFGWDEGLQIVTASNDVWTAYLKSHPKAALFRRNPFPLYDKVYTLVEGKTATGDFALQVLKGKAQLYIQLMIGSSISDDDDDDIGNDIENDSTPTSVPLKRSISSASLSSTRSREKRKQSIYKSEVASAIQDLSKSIGLIKGDHIGEAIDIVQKWEESKEISEDDLDTATRVFMNEVKAKIFCRLSSKMAQMRFLQREIKALNGEE